MMTANKEHTMIQYEALTRKSREYDRINNECGEGYNPYHEQLHDLSKSCIAQKIADASAVWTLDVTIERRAAWNDDVNSGGSNLDREKRLGFRVVELKAAVAKHQL